MRPIPCSTNITDMVGFGGTSRVDGYTSVTVQMLGMFLMFVSALIAGGIQFAAKILPPSSEDRGAIIAICFTISLYAVIGMALVAQGMTNGKL